MMKHLKSFNGVTLLMVTVITVLGLISMIPAEERILPDFLTGYLPYGSLDEKIPEDRMDLYFHTIIDQDEKQEKEIFMIDDGTLDRFIEVYVRDIKGQGTVKELSVGQREEVRMVLENMGYWNAVHLKELLDQKIDAQVVEQLKILLGENLFDSEIKYLDGLVGIK